MKKAILFLIALAICFSVLSQEKVKQKEVGFVFSNFDNFGLLLKRGTNKFMWRFNTMLLSGGKNQNIDTIITKNIGFNTSIGNEFRKKFADNFEFCFGYDLSYTYSWNKEMKNYSQWDKPFTKIIYSSPGINLVFGFNYVLKDHLVIGVEILPNYNYYIRNIYTGNEYEYTRIPNTKRTESKGFNYGLSNTSARLSIAYRF